MYYYIMLFERSIQKTLGITISTVRCLQLNADRISVHEINNYWPTT